MAVVKEDEERRREKKMGWMGDMIGFGPSNPHPLRGEQLNGQAEPW